MASWEPLFLSSIHSERSAGGHPSPSLNPMRWWVGRASFFTCLMKSPVRFQGVQGPEDKEFPGVIQGQDGTGKLIIYIYIIIYIYTLCIYNICI